TVMTQGGFFTGRIPLSYATAGSFMRWLMDTYGLERFRRLFQLYSPWIPNAQAQWKQIYGKSLDQLANEWEGFLANEVPLDDRGRAIVKFSYEQPAFINQVCARVVAKHQAAAQQAFSLGLYQTAVDEYQRLWEFQPGNLYHLFGKFAALADAGRYPEALAVSEEILLAPNLNLALKARTHQERADMFLRMADWKQAREELDLVLQLGSFGTMERDARIKLALIDLPAAPRRSLIKGLTGEQTNALYHFANARAALGMENWILPYLLGRRFSMVGDFAASCPLHADFLETPGAREWVHRVHGLPPLAKPPASPLPEVVMREELLTAIRDAAFGHDLWTAIALEAFIRKSRKTGVIPWSPADWQRLEDAAGLASFLGTQSLRTPPWSVADRVGAALSGATDTPMPESAEELPEGAPQPIPDPALAPPEPTPASPETAAPPVPH
ncbi:MAG TPA: hypothetical protein VEI97_02650, partial [bacterium]|nr:hypothetical protein [bacterium]